MPIALQNLNDISDWNFDDIIDVRSPAEFAEDHIPGAINMPALSNEERAVVGTIYVQESTFKAKRIGAALVARNAADHIENQMAEKDGSWRPLVHCWRGGQRSGSFASILQQIGWRAEVLEGGYKAYRRQVVKALYDQPVPHKIIVIDGNTGSAKTELLDLLAQAGEQVIDLEGMAAHRGSLFGAMEQDQPSQKMFEGRVAMALTKSDPSRPIFVEAESNKIGDIMIPTSLWRAMIKAPRITIKAPLEARSEFLMRSYSDLLEDHAQLITRINRLREFHSKDQIAAWLDCVSNHRFLELAESLMRLHYDPRYAKTYARGAREELGSVEMNSLDRKSLIEKAVPSILELSSKF